MKIALGIEYYGTPYCGWQRQGASDNSIQRHVEHALSTIADHQVKVYCAGRTDASVHARHQVVHFETDSKREMYSWTAGGNVHLPHSISILWAKDVADDFHARFSAIKRAYRYIILNRTSKPGVYHSMVTWERQVLDESRMQLAAKALIGKHDFTSFRAAGCQARNAVRNVKKLDLYRIDDFVILDIEANAFLHHMVRNIAGALIKVGRGEVDITWVADVLALKDVAKLAKTAAPDGLYLVAIQYPEIYGIPMPINSQLYWLR